MTAYAPVTRILVGLNIAVFLLVSLFLGAQPDPAAMHNFFEQWGLVAADFWNAHDWKPLQPVTSMFLHGGFLHLFVNMFGVWSLGISLERTLGSLRFLALYMVSGLSGALAVILMQQDLTTPTIGASGALLGLLGAIAVFFPSSQMLVFFIPMKARTAAIVFGGISILLAFIDSSSGISHWGHVGGLVGGILYSKFALGLNIARQTFSEQPVNDFFARRMRRNREEEEMIHFLNDFFRKGGEPPRREKVINPGPADEPDERPRHGPPLTPDEPTGGRRLYFDPATGRFFFR